MTMTTRRLALIVRGGWDGHDPIATTDALLPFLRENGYDIRIEDSPAVYADAAAMAEVSVIIQCTTMSAIEPEQIRGLVTAVRSGVGLAGWHGGIVDSYRTSAEYLQLTGGQFVTHPAKAAQEDLPRDGTDCFIEHSIEIVPDRATHPIVAGLEDFSLTTEQYWVLTDDLNDVLATTTVAAPTYEPWSRPVTCPAVWTRVWGDGRVFVATPGHDLSTVLDPNVRTIIERGILWASN